MSCVSLITDGTGSSPESTSLADSIPASRYEMNKNFSDQYGQALAYTAKRRHQLKFPGGLRLENLKEELVRL